MASRGPSVAEEKYGEEMEEKQQMRRGWSKDERKMQYKIHGNETPEQHLSHISKEANERMLERERVEKEREKAEDDERRRREEERTQRPEQKQQAAQRQPKQGDVGKERLISPEQDKESFPFPASTTEQKGYVSESGRGGQSMYEGMPPGGAGRQQVLAQQGRDPHLDASAGRSNASGSGGETSLQMARRWDPSLQDHGWGWHKMHHQLQHLHGHPVSEAWLRQEQAKLEKIERMKQIEQARRDELPPLRYGRDKLDEESMETVDDRDRIQLQEMMDRPMSDAVKDASRREAAVSKAKLEGQDPLSVPTSIDEEVTVKQRSPYDSTVKDKTAAYRAEMDRTREERRKLLEEQGVEDYRVDEANQPLDGRELRPTLAEEMKHNVSTLAHAIRHPVETLSGKKSAEEDERDQQQLTRDAKKWSEGSQNRLVMPTKLPQGSSSGIFVTPKPTVVTEEGVKAEELGLEGEREFEYVLERRRQEAQEQQPSSHAVRIREIVPDESRSITEDAKSKLAAVESRAEDAAESVKDKAEDVWIDARTKLRRFAIGTKEKMQNVKEDTKEKMQDVKKDTQDVLRDVENKMGELKDATKSKLKAAGRGAIDSTEQVTDSMQSKGNELAEGVKDQLDRGREALRDDASSVRMAQESSEDGPFRESGPLQGIDFADETRGTIDSYTHVHNHPPPTVQDHGTIDPVTHLRRFQTRAERTAREVEDDAVKMKDRVSEKAEHAKEVAAEKMERAKQDVRRDFDEARMKARETRREMSEESRGILSRISSWLGGGRRTSVDRSSVASSPPDTDFIAPVTISPSTSGLNRGVIVETTRSSDEGHAPQDFLESAGNLPWTSQSMQTKLDELRRSERVESAKERAREIKDEMRESLHTMKEDLKEDMSAVRPDSSSQGRWATPTTLDHSWRTSRAPREPTMDRLKPLPHRYEEGPSDFAESYMSIIPITQRDILHDKMFEEHLVETME